MTVLFTVLFSALLSNHPLHVSCTSIDISTEKKEASLTFKFYTDDFSLLFFHLYEKTLKPEIDQELTNTQLALINTYMDHSFSIVTGKDTVDLNFLRKEQDDVNIWLYYKGSLPKNLGRNVFLTNTLLLDLYGDQTNLVIVTQGKAEKGYTFNYNSYRQELDIEQD